MSKYLINKAEIIVDAGEIFASEVVTKEVKLNNYQSAKVLIGTGEGEKATTIARVVAILPDASEQEIKTQEITIGGKEQTEINVVANELAHYDATSFKVKIDAVADSAIGGEIIVLLGEPRYAVETEIVETTEEVVEDTTETTEEVAEDTTETTEE